MHYTLGTLFVAIIALVLLTQGESTNKKPVKQKEPPLAPVSRYQKISPNVFNEADGSIAQVKTWIQQNIADPAASVQDWGQVNKAGRGYEARVVVRNQKAEGGWVASKYKFEFNALGEIMSAYDVEEHAKQSHKDALTLQAELNEVDQQILSMRAQLEGESAALANAKRQGKITSRGIKVENIYKILQELHVRREVLAAQLAQMP